MPDFVPEDIPEKEKERPSHVFVSVPTVRPSDPLVRELADGIMRIERNYQREGSGPGTRFEGKLLEDVQAAWVMRELLTRESNRDAALPGWIMPPGMAVTAAALAGQIELTCQDHGSILTAHSQGLRTLAFEARRHWREQHV